MLLIVAAAQGLRHMPAVARFIARYPGTAVEAGARAHPGLPVWVDATHFLNLLLMVFIIRSGIQILADHPRLYWTRHSTPGKDWFRFQRPVPEDPLWTAKQDAVTLPRHLGLPGLRHSIGLARWWHLGTDMLWLANGIAFYALLLVTGQWRRVVPTSWSVFPNAASVLVQYLSLQWPKESAWIAYNGLQQLAHFVTVFVAAPLTLLTGLGMSPALSTRFERISKPLSIQVARSLHFLVLCWFLVFILIDTTLVFTTGLLRNLNMGYAARDSGGWVGFGVFAASMAVVAVAWVAATPLTLRRPRLVQRVGFALIGPLQRLFEHVDTKPGEYSEKDIPRIFGAQTVCSHRPRGTGGCSTPACGLPPSDPRPGGASRGAEPGGGAGAPPPPADHPALLHPGVVGSGQVGRRVDGNDPRARPTQARGSLGGLLLAGRQAGRGSLLRRAPHRTDAQSPDHARLPDERRAALL